MNVHTEICCGEYGSGLRRHGAQKAGVDGCSKLSGELYPMVEEADHLQLTRLARLLRKKNISSGQATELAELIS